jgi:putative membrane protein
VKPFRLAGLTLRRLAGDSTLVRAAVVAITLVPLLYGALYLWAFWDPYGALDRLPVAVVNLDRPVTVDGERLHAGADLVDKLLDGGDVDWQVVSADEASAGLKARRYYLSLTIPADFSHKLSTAKSAAPKRARLLVVAQESSSMLASQIMSRVFGEVRAAASSSASEKYLDKMFIGFSDAHKGLTDAAAGAKDLGTGLATAHDGSVTLASGLDSADAGAWALTGGLVTLRNGSAKAAAGATTVSTGTAALARGLAGARAGSAKTAAGARSLARGAAKANGGSAQVAGGAASLASGLSSAKSGATQVAGGASSLSDGLGELVAALDKLRAGGDALVSAVTSLSAGASSLDAGVGYAASRIGDAADGAEQVESGATALDKALGDFLKNNPSAAADSDFQTALYLSGKVKAGSSDLASGLAAAKAQSSVLAAGSAKVSDGATSLQHGMRSLSVGLASASGGCSALSAGASALASGGTNLSAGVKAAASGASTLAKGSAQVASGTRTLASGAWALSGGMSTLSAGVVTAASGASQLAAGARKLRAGNRTIAAGAVVAETGASSLANGIDRLDTGAASLADGLSTAQSGSEELRDGLTAGAKKVPNYGAGLRSLNASMMSDPVALSTERRGEVPTYGTGFAPYFIPLALWVGAVLTFFIVKPLPDRAVAAGAPAYVTALAGYLPGAAIGTMQAVILLAVVQFGLGLHPVSVAGFYAIGVLTALVSIAMMQMFNAALGAVGKLVSIILLMLQLTSAAGTFPLQMIPGFFQSLHPFLPMTYVIDAMRQAISGGDLASAALSSAVLAVFGAGSLIITVAAADRAQTYTMERLHPSLEL